VNEKLFIPFLFVVGIVLGIMHSLFVLLLDSTLQSKSKTEPKEDKEPELIRPEALKKFIK
jgi:uncharacterized protein YhhL (DUF1145 family)